MILLIILENVLAKNMIYITTINIIQSYSQLVISFVFFNTLGSMLQVNPTTRPTVEDVHAELIALALDNNIDMKAPVVVCIYF